MQFSFFQDCDPLVRNRFHCLLIFSDMPSSNNGVTVLQLGSLYTPRRIIFWNSICFTYMLLSLEFSRSLCWGGNGVTIFFFFFYYVFILFIALIYLWSDDCKTLKTNKTYKKERIIPPHLMKTCDFINLRSSLRLLNSTLVVSFLIFDI